MSKFIILIAITLVSAACGFFIGQQTKSSANFDASIIDKTKKPDFLKTLQNEKIKSFQSWEDTDYFGIVRQLNEPCSKEYSFKSCQKFSVYAESGKIVFEYKDFVIESFIVENLTRKDFQIIIETNSGGTDNFLKIIDYNNGKFTEIINSNKTQMRGGYWSTPEYRTGIKILISNQIKFLSSDKSAELMKILLLRFLDFEMENISESAKSKCRYSAILLKSKLPKINKKLFLFNWNQRENIQNNLPTSVSKF